MSALCGVVHPGAAYLLTDGASFDAQHNVRQIGSKVLELPTHRMAIGWSGYLMIEDLQAAVIAAGITQADVFLALPAIVRDLAFANEAVGVRDGVPTPPVYLLIALWNEARNEPQLWAVDSCTTLLGPRYTPFTHVQLRAKFALHPDEQAAAFGRQIKPTDPANFDVRRDGVTMIETERAKPFEGGHYGVGGFVELTSVTVDGVTKETLLQWNDKIGHRINPARSGTRT